MTAVATEIPKCAFPGCTRLVHSLSTGELRVFRGRTIALCGTHVGAFDAGGAVLREAVYTGFQAGMDRLQKTAKRSKPLRTALGILKRGLASLDED